MATRKTQGKRATPQKRTRTTAKTAKPGPAKKVSQIKTATASKPTRRVSRTRKAPARPAAAPPFPLETAELAQETDRSLRRVSEPTYEEIATRAYYLYLERSRSGGGELGDWIQAEAQLRGTSRLSR
jgi:hypothetical protein